MGKGLIHRRKGIRHADDAFTVAECLVEGLPEGEGNILHRVMHINVQVALRLYGQIEQTVDGEMGQHMIEKADPCRYFVLAGPIQIKIDSDLRLICLS